MRISQKIFLINSEGKILALRRSASDPSRPLTWDLPGGDIEEGEDLSASVKREVSEEIGLILDDVSLFDIQSGIDKRGKYSIQIAYLAEVQDGDIKLSYEHDEFRWVTKDEFLQLESTDKIKKFLQKM